MACLCAPGPFWGSQAPAWHKERGPAPPQLSALCWAFSLENISVSASGLGMSSGQVATRPGPARPRTCPPVIAPTTGRRLPSGDHLCQDRGSPDPPTRLVQHVGPGATSPSQGLAGPDQGQVREPRADGGLLGPEHGPHSGGAGSARVRVGVSPAPGASRPCVKWGDGPARLPCSQEPQCPCSQIQKLRPEGARPRLPSLAEAGQGADPAPTGPPPADLLPPRPSGGRRWERATALPPSPRWLPPGRPGHWAQVSRTAGSSASSRPRLSGARGRVTPQGPPVRTPGRRGGRRAVGGLGRL